MLDNQKYAQYVFNFFTSKVYRAERFFTFPTSWIYRLAKY